MTVIHGIDRVYLVLALVAALSGTWPGAAAAALTLTVVGIRVAARRHLASVARGGGVLATAQDADTLDAPRDHGEPVAGAGRPCVQPG